LFNRFATWWPASGWAGFSDQLAVLEQIRLPAVLVLAGAAVFTLAAAISLRLSRPGLAFCILTGMMAPIFILVHWGFLVMEPFQSGRQVADILKSLGPNEVIVCQEPREYKWLSGINFYTRQMVYVLKDPQFDGNSSHRREPAERFLNPEQFQQLWKSGKKVALVLEDADKKPAGILLQDGRVHVVARVGSRAVVANEPSAASVTGG
jgi:hypothetical protein